MAKLIFTLNSAGKASDLYRMAQDQDFLNANKNFEETQYDIIDITTEEFNDVKKGIKIPISHNGSTVTFETVDYPALGPITGETSAALFETQTQLIKYIDTLLEVFDVYLRFNPNKPLATIITSYITYLKELDTLSLTPLNITLEQYAMEQGQNPVHLLEVL